MGISMSFDPSVKFVRDRAAQYFGIPLDLVLMDVRDPRVCEARFAGYWAARQLVHAGVEDIGRIFRRNASTITMGLRRIEDLMNDRPQFREKLKSFLAEVGDELHQVEEERHEAYARITLQRSKLSTHFVKLTTLPPVQWNGDSASSAV
jgi:hypothetical protein